MIRLVQIARGNSRRVARVDGEVLRRLPAPSVYALAMIALHERAPLADAIEASAAGEQLDYEQVWRGRSEWRLLPPIDHPETVYRMLVSGTGLTHMASVERRNAMHAGAQQETDSMRMYKWGVEGGKPGQGEAGVAPEWFYKGDGSIVRAHNESLEIPAFAEDGGEEPEIAGVYVIDESGAPRRIGFTQGNEFSDHAFEKRNYLYLAHSKLRQCSLGPELLVGGAFEDVHGEVRVERAGSVLWRSDIQSGEKTMCHSVANLEHHHFKYAQHRRPGDLHVHFFGADAFSFGAGITLQDGDVTQVAFEGFGKPLRNPIRRTAPSNALQTVTNL